MDQIGKGEEEIVSDHHHKSCADCKTTKTPLWRSGPSGPKSLCNACGIRYRKKRAVTTTRDAKKYPPEKKESAAEEEGESGNGIGNETSYKKRKVSEELRSRVMALGEEVVELQRQQQPRSPVRRRRRRKSNDHYWRKMGEVEQAAVLLMALSCGSVF